MVHTKKPITRRRALALAVGQAGAAAGGTPRARLVPRDQLVSVPEFEEQAFRALSPAMASLISDRVDKSGERVDRQDFDRITLRPRMCVPTLDLDLLGRATRWALAAFGPPGVQRLLEMMQRELVEAAAAAGRTSRAAIDARAVRPRFV